MSCRGLDIQRKAMFTPYWEHLQESLRILQESESSNRSPTLRMSMPEPRLADVALRDLHPQDRERILAVATYEIHMILLWTRVQANVARLRRDNGLV